MKDLAVAEYLVCDISCCHHLPDAARVERLEYETLSLAIFDPWLVT
jgi:hypothetical protein